MKRNLFQLFLLLALVLTSCKKMNVKSYPDFVGDWSGTDGYATYSLNVSESGGVTLQKVAGAVTSTFSGKFKLYDNILKIGVKKFDVTAYPAIDSTSTWTLGLDGITYEK